MKLPKKIMPCPLIDAVIELRFNPTIENSAVFGIIYNALRDEYKEVEKLPITELPETIRYNDLNLLYKPHYRITDKKYIVQIGPRVLSISSPPDYVGWDKFQRKAVQCLMKFYKLDILDNVVRLGLRYINFFDEDIFNNIKLGLKLNNKKFISQSLVIRSSSEQGGVKNTLQLSNNAEHSIDEIRKGSVIDIDVYLNERIDNLFKEIKTLLDKIHIEEKKLFFNLLKEKYLKKLNPTY